MTPAERFKAYTRWLRYIHETHPPLPKGIRRSTLLAYCQAQARDGAYGMNCFASDTRIAKELEINQRKYVAPYRRLAIELGWFVPSGKKDRRVVGLDIAIPSGVADSTGDQNLSPDDGEHDSEASSLEECAACKPLMAMVSEGRMTVEQAQQRHCWGFQ